MSVVKKTSEYTISKRRDGRFAVVGSNKRPINGEEKVKILLAEDLVKVVATVVAPEPEEETAAAEPTAEDAVAQEGESAPE